MRPSDILLRAGLISVPMRPYYFEVRVLFEVSYTSS
jgi:hypothetical protein